MSKSPSPRLEGEGEFPRFASLPAELRQRIWLFSFSPRAVEIHSCRPHYADAFRKANGSVVPKWQSRCANPALLSVNVEARDVALRQYTIKLPLKQDVPYHAVGDGLDLDRVLYICPEEDTIAVLGEMDFHRMTLLLSDMRFRDPSGTGLRRLAISTRWISHPGAGRAVQLFVQGLCPDLDALVVFIYNDPAPPKTWNSGICRLGDYAEDEQPDHFLVRYGQELRDREGNLMIMGTGPVQLKELIFRN
jgi:hypothetical protein